MALDQSAVRSRRAVLAAAGGAVAAWLAYAFGRIGPVAATDGDTMHVGEALSGSTLTQLTNTNATSDGAFQGVGPKYGVGGVSNTGVGLMGSSGASVPTPLPRTGVQGWADAAADARAVWGRTNQGVAVEGDSGSSYGVLGKSTSGIGVAGRGGQAQPSVYGVTAHASGHGVRGRNDATGTTGYLGGAYGVRGDNGENWGALGGTSYGVQGRTTTSWGMYGTATSGTGVAGISDTGTGGRFSSTSGRAIHSSGRLFFARASGFAVVPNGESGVWVSHSFDLTGNTKVLATMMTSTAVKRYIAYVLVDTYANRFRIALNDSAPADMRVAWLVLD